MRKKADWKIFWSEIESQRKKLEAIAREEDMKRVQKNPVADFLHGCPYFLSNGCASTCWSLVGPCGVCLKEQKYNPNNAKKGKEELKSILGKESITKTR